MRIVLNALLAVALATAAASAAPNDYLVFVEGDDYRPAAEKLAVHHGGIVIPFEAAKLDAVLAAAREHTPRFVAFVLPPAKIDVDLAHDILELAVRVDDDVFVDFEYGFITGRDGAAAAAFVDRVIAASKRSPGREAAMFGSWEGRMKPMRGKFTALEAMGLDGKSHYVMTRSKPDEQRTDSRAALEQLGDTDALLFFSHGYPDRMVACFRAQDLRDWKIGFRASLLVNCACYNGAPGRWFAPGRGGPVDRGVVEPADSVALQILDSGVACYIAGIDPWHGPLAFQVFDLIAGEGMRVGEATKRMFDRLALDFAPEKVDFPPTLEHRRRFSGEGTNNRRHNGGGMILYGDPAFRPWPNARPRAIGEIGARDGDGWSMRVGTRPLIDGKPSEDFMLPMNVLLDYYSVKSAKNFMKQLAMEFHRVVPLPQGCPERPVAKAVRGRLGIDGKNRGEIDAKAPHLAVERTPRGSFLHVRVPLKQPWMPPGKWPAKIARHGAVIELRLPSQ